MKCMERCRRALLLAALWLHAPLAFAHAALVSSEPGRRAVLTTPPSQIRLCFNENVEAKFSQVTLSRAGEDGSLALGRIALDTGSANCLQVPIKSPLTNGNYTVRYRVLSVDGHVVDYGYGFRLNAPW
ncbi:copper resistance CopC family protein [Solimonas sp. SE-A11]|uniref:copper resistance CopC family protein n=1 Tax=Solimonas sp. SE-A11 TaxID=3054954 RepID=UPI00259CEB83|nr:copper resistance CopC family protein [Solimonas sp. SE-A11]MDM4771499.1 copper resistance protein CopC [Solimonas sp. SE-A11]